MERVTIRELRNQGGAVVDRAERGERIVVTRDGRPVAELGPVSRSRMTAETLLVRWRELPPVDVDSFRADLDQALDPCL